MIRIGFIGMTHLGINSSAAAAGRGSDVLCFDPDALLIARLNKEEFPIIEPGLPELIQQNSDRIKFTSDPVDLGQCDIIYVSPDISTDENGNSDLSTIDELVTVAENYRAAGAVCVVLSQVPPGYMRSRIGGNSHWYYQVETLIFGDAVDRALNPERIIVGCNNPGKSLDARLASFYRAFECPVFPMNYESAELAKISINCFLVSSVSTANTLAELCEQIGADWREIVPALRLDKRIGPHAYILPGLGIAGGNLERDLATVVALSGACGSDSRVVRAWQENSHYRKDWALRTLHEFVIQSTSDPVIGVLGLTYKPATHSTKNSPAVKLISALKGFSVNAYDPVVSRLDPSWHTDAKLCTSPLDACRGADAVIVMTPWPDFQTIPPSDLASVMNGRFVLDPYGALDGKKYREAGLIRVRLGSRRPVLSQESQIQ